VPLPLILSVGLFESDQYFGGDSSAEAHDHDHDHGPSTSTTMGPMITMPTTIDNCDHDHGHCEHDPGHDHH
jgi:hypothetical protein